MRLKHNSTQELIFLLLNTEGPLTGDKVMEKLANKRSGMTVARHLLKMSKADVHISRKLKRNPATNRMCNFYFAKITYAQATTQQPDPTQFSNSFGTTDIDTLDRMVWTKIVNRAPIEEVMNIYKAILTHPGYNS